MPRKKVDEIEEALVTAAAGIVGDVGPEGLNISFVARRAGVPREQAYEYFRTREELITAINFRISQELESIMTIDSGMSDFIDYVVDYVVAHPEVARLWLYQTVTDNRVSSEASVTKFYGFVETLSRHPAFQDGVDAEMFAQICLSATLSWSMYANARLSAEHPAEEWVGRYARELKRLMLFGMTRPECFPDAVASLNTAPSPPPDKPKKSNLRVVARHRS
jgi:AcrR family transcriptional regulator